MYYFKLKLDKIKMIYFMNIFIRVEEKIILNLGNLINFVNYS